MKLWILYLWKRNQQLFLNLVWWKHMIGLTRIFSSVSSIILVFRVDGLWISACISSPRYFMNINGTPQGFFTSSRGIRKGDLLFPFLFILMVEVLSRAVKWANALSFWKEIRVSNLNECYTHNLFTDDTLLFGEATLEEHQIIQRIIEDYSSSLGQLVNTQKSKIFFNNVGPMVQQRLSQFWGFTLGSISYTFYFSLD